MTVSCMIDELEHYLVDTSLGLLHAEREGYIGKYAID